MINKKDLVEIVLENCEVYGFLKKDVDVYLDGLSKHYIGGEEFTDVEHCAIFFYEKPDKPLKVMIYEDFTEKDWWKRITRCPDITQIHIDGQIYFVKWGDDEYTNPYQTCLEKDGRKIIIISKTRQSDDDF